MARKRMLTQSINIDEDFNLMSDEAQLLFLKLITITDDCGIIPGSAFSIQSLVSLSANIKKNFSKYLQEITEKKLLLPISHNEKYFFCFKKDSFEENQKFLIKNRTKSEYLKLSVDEYYSLYRNLREFTVIYSDNDSYHIERIKIEIKKKEKREKIEIKDKDAGILKNESLEIIPETEKKFNLQNECKLIFEDYYLQTKNLKYSYNGKSAGALAGIIKQIKVVSNKENITDAEVLKGFEYLIYNISDVWILNNLDLSIINSQFNKILSKIKNGESTGKGYSPENAKWNRIFANIEAEELRKAGQEANSGIITRP